MKIISPRAKKLLIIFLCWGYAFLIKTYLEIPDRKNHLFFLNIGQGDSIFIKTEENHQILIDGGPGNFVLEELNSVIPFFDKTIDLIVLSHPHADHMEGLIEVLERYEVQYALISGAIYKSKQYDEFLSRLKKNNVKILIANSQNDLKFGDAKFDVLYPFSSFLGEEFDNVNNSSIAVKIDFGEEKLLMTGDLELEAEEELIDSGVDLRADIFKAGHHGSRTSSSMKLLQSVRPKTVVIQAGVDNKFDHPHPESLRNFYRIGVEKIYRNDLDGRVEFEF